MGIIIVVIDKLFNNREFDFEEQVSLIRAANVFRYPMKPSKNYCLSHIFRTYRKNQWYEIG